MRRKQDWRPRDLAYQKRLELKAAALFPEGCFDCQDRGILLEYSHETPTSLAGRGRGKRRRLLDVIRHPKSYRRRCRPCHRAYDAKRGEWHPPTGMPTYEDPRWGSAADWVEQVEEVPF